MCAKELTGRAAHVDTTKEVKGFPGFPALAAESLGTLDTYKTGETVPPTPEPDQDKAVLLTPEKLRAEAPTIPLFPENPVVDTTSFDDLLHGTPAFKLDQVWKTLDMFIADVTARIGPENASRVEDNSFTIPDNAPTRLGIITGEGSRLIPMLVRLKKRKELKEFHLKFEHIEKQISHAYTILQRAIDRSNAPESPDNNAFIDSIIERTTEEFKNLRDILEDLEADLKE